jgi:hypothetical protein
LRQHPCLPAPRPGIQGDYLAGSKCKLYASVFIAYFSTRDCPGEARNGIHSGEGKSENNYQVSGLERLTPAGLGTFELKGKGTENDKKGEVRFTLKIGRN